MPESSKTDLYEIEVSTPDGGKQKLDKFRGQVLLVVNTASKCGFTPQYDGLNELHRKYREMGFSVLGFPCNQFGEQEPGSNQEIAEFCNLNFKTEFPIFAKIDVNGSDESALFKFLKAEAPGFLGTKAIKWNFTKFLVDRKGHVVARFAPQEEPVHLEKPIQELLGQ